MQKRMNIKMKNPFLSILFVLFVSASLEAGSWDSQFEEILGRYFEIHQALAQDSTDGVDAAARQIAEIAASVHAHDEQSGKLLNEIREAAQQMQGTELDHARHQFFELSKPLLVYFNQSYAGKTAANRFYCSMENKAWMQTGEKAQNPYYGSSMIGCGEPVK